MKKFIISAIFILTFGGYVFYHNAAQSASTTYTASTEPQPITTSAPTETTNPTPSTPSSPATPPPVTKPKGLYADGTYTGTSADAYYGNVQVEATISGGRLIDVTFLQYPNDRSESRLISSRAMPALKSEAISAQSSNVDIVSGATQTSEAFQQSLADALSQAKS